MMESIMSTGLSQEEERSNLRTFYRLVTAIEASDGKLNLLLAVCDRTVERDDWIRRYETELQEKGLRCYRVQLASRSPSLKQSLLELQEQGGVLGSGAIVSVLGAAELLDLRLGEDRSALEKLLFSLQWTREALRAFECSIVIWVSNKVANGIATTSPDFWSWRGNSVFEFASQKVQEKAIEKSGYDLNLSDIALTSVSDIVLVKPKNRDYQSTLGVKAESQWTELEMMMISDPKSPLLANLYQNLGFTERDRGNWETATIVFKQAIQLDQQSGNRSLEARCIGGLGDIERERGNWDAAELLYRQSLKLSEELGDRLCIATAWGVLGNIECNRGNWDAAELLYRQYQELSEELGDQLRVAIAIGCLGENELGRGNLDKAETLLKEALSQMQQLGMTDSIAETNWDLAQLYHAKNNPELAQQHYTIAHQLFTQLGAKKEIEKLEVRMMS
jgi:tetratricopeptide (TPR) repeat protein